MKRKFTRTMNNLTRLLDESISGDVVTKKFQEVEDLWLQIQNKHDEYVSLLANSTEIDEDGWLDEVESAFLEIQMRVLKNSKKAQQQMKLAEVLEKLRKWHLIH